MLGIWDRWNLVPLARWHVLIPNFEVSTSAFYDRVRKLIAEQEIPDLEVREVVFREGGAFTPGRRYLRIRRERLVFDFCSAPFGTSWFFSCRFGEIPMSLKWWEKLLLAAVASGILWLHGQLFGWVWGGAIFALNVFSLLFLLNGLFATGLYGLDAVLLRMPVLGAFYECVLRPDSYYREDTRRMYYAGLDKLLRDAIEEFTAQMPEGAVVFEEQPPAHGIRLWDRIKKGLKFPWMVSPE